jgi:hypothetical protein
MSCRRIHLQLSALLDGELPANRRPAVEAHLESCAACRARLQQLRKLNAGISMLPALTPAPELLTAVRRKLAAAQPDRPGVSWADRLFHPWWVKVPLEALAAVAILVIIIVAIRPAPHRGPVMDDSGRLTANGMQLHLDDDWADGDVGVAAADAEDRRRAQPQDTDFSYGEHAVELSDRLGVDELAATPSGGAGRVGAVLADSLEGSRDASDRLGATRTFRPHARLVVHAADLREVERTVERLAPTFNATVVRTEPPPPSDPARLEETKMQRQTILVRLPAAQAEAFKATVTRTYQLPTPSAGRPHLELAEPQVETDLYFRSGKFARPDAAESSPPPPTAAARPATAPAVTAFRGTEQPLARSSVDTPKQEAEGESSMPDVSAAAPPPASAPATALTLRPLRDPEETQTQRERAVGGLTEFRRETEGQVAKDAPAPPTKQALQPADAAMMLLEIEVIKSVE